jgi:hypothetical protein
MLIRFADLGYAALRRKGRLSGLRASQASGAPFTETSQGLVNPSCPCMLAFDLPFEVSAGGVN